MTRANRRVGVLVTSSTPDLDDAFRKGLRELGWIEGKNIALDHRFGEEKGFERLKELAVELVQLKVDVIVARSTNDALAAKQATSTIPIVMASGGDPVAAGLINSLAHPGGNITGVTSLSPELNTKRLEILKDAVSKPTLVGVLFLEATTGVGVRRQIKELDPAAEALKLKLVYLEAKQEPKGLENAFETAKRKGVAALLTLNQPSLFAVANRIVDLSSKHRLPAIYVSREFVDEGGLMSYGINYPDQYRRAAYFVDRILRGTKPADLPVEQPMKFEFIINLKAAKQIGLTIPPEVLARANKVIR